MAQDTLLEMLHRPRSLPPFSEEEQALMNAMAEREQAETRAKRTAERPGISDAAWRAAYGVADVVDPVVGSLADFAIGATVGTDPFSRTQPIWEQRPSMQEVGELAGTILPVGAVGRASRLRRSIREGLNPRSRREIWSRERYPENDPRIELSGPRAGSRDPMGLVPFQMPPSRSIVVGDLFDQIRSGDSRYFTRLMSPEDYMKIVPTTSRTPYGKTSSVKAQLDHVKAGGQLAPPWLSVYWDSKNKRWVTTGQEGRSRTITAKELGLDELPVDLFPDKNYPFDEFTALMEAAPISSIEGW
ncbi:hypothetical protein [uncultured Mediterranean phage uvDeep-CGR2-AD3-C76]|nr:hypothetical protein [uncultured Mediterranean phage uvDeep-CGR2-AD3-C76]